MHLCALQGLGKTLQTISLVAYLNEFRGIKVSPCTTGRTTSIFFTPPSCPSAGVHAMPCLSMSLKIPEGNSLFRCANQ